MINPVECRQYAVDCQRMAERAPNLRVKSILIDISRTWERLALETEQAAPKDEQPSPSQPRLQRSDLVSLGRHQNERPK
jgi:hypothetical protein